MTSSCGFDHNVCRIVQYVQRQAISGPEHPLAAVCRLRTNIVAFCDVSIVPSIVISLPVGRHVFEIEIHLAECTLAPTAKSKTLGKLLDLVT